MSQTAKCWEDAYHMQVAALEKDNLRLRLEQAKFRTALAKIADQPKGLDYERFAKHTAARVLGRKKH